MKKINSAIAITLFVVLMSSCFSNKRQPGWDYMPDMRYSQAYETYSADPYLKDSMTNQKMPHGTIPLYYNIIGNFSNYHPYYYSNTEAGYDSAGKFVNDTLYTSVADLLEGKRNFGIYCSVCHGATGKADGSIVVNADIKQHFPPPPSYYADDKLTLPIGKMFHTVHYGKGLMGSYAAQLDQKQVWQILHFIKGMQADYVKAQAPATSDSTKASGNP